LGESDAYDNASSAEVRLWLDREHSRPWLEVVVVQIKSQLEVDRGALYVINPWKDLLDWEL
jgi:hypothetical protein